MIILLMGVSGSGKTTIGKYLAKSLNWEFHDGDSFHLPTNIEKMRRGIPLNDADRMPWLQLSDCILNSNVKGMMQNHCLAKSVISRKYLN